MNKATKLLTCFGLLLNSSISLADIDCAGTVSGLSLTLDNVGTVILSIGGGPANVYLCAVDGVRNGVSPTVCRSMYSTLLATKMADKKISIRFYGYSSCTAVPPWADPGPLGWNQLLLD